MQRRHHATGRLMCWLAAGLWCWLVGSVAADDPPQPYLEEPQYEMAPHLLGSQDSFRERLADAGVTILADNTGFYIGNTNGGFAQAFDYAGHGDYCVIADGGKLGVRDGLYLKLRAEHRYGETIVGNVGCFISPTLIADLPVYDSEEVYLTNVLLTQELSDAFSVFAGKMDTLDGDMNAFAHGRGKTQFSNMGFVFNPIVGATVPYSTLGAGFVIHPDDGPMAMVTVLNSTDTTATSGFDTLFNDGLLLSAAVRVPTNLFDRPGHQLLGGTWNSRTYTSITEAYIPYPDVAIPTTRGSWCLYWNFDQFLVVDPADDTRGWGPFGRAGIADPNTSPIDAFLSFGFGGNVLGRSRRNDTFGIGWYWASASPEIGTLITSQFGPVGDGQGIECFYNYAVTSAIRITPDLQYVVPTLRLAEPAVIAGVRALVSF
ncbi:MAG: carbohydrate porin [Planctomycetia bacterium]|nr:carbohydrate porin [Planctomycetia bacterium]